MPGLRNAVWLILPLLTLPFPMLPALADLQFCNRTEIELMSAVGEKPDSEYLSTGWYRIKPDKCVIVIDGDLSDDTYWAFAINSKKDYKTAGDRDFCVMNKKAFSGLKLGGCDSESDRRKEAFVEVDVGDEKNYRVDFLGKAGDTSASVKKTKELDSSGKGGGATTQAGGGCTGSVNKICGDPSGMRVARADATRIVPDLVGGPPEGASERLLWRTQRAFIHPASIDDRGRSAELVVPFDFVSLDPHYREWWHRRNAAVLTELIHEPLLRRTAWGGVQGALAESWETGSPGEWDVKLRKGVEFHTGAAFSADDVVFSIDRFNAMRSAIGLPPRVVSLEKVDEFTVKLASPGTSSEEALADALDEILMVSKTWTESRGQDGIDLNPIGTGPFKLVSVEPMVRAKLERNEEWWGNGASPVLFEELVVEVVADRRVIAAAIATGEAHFALLPFREVEARIFQPLLRDSRFRVASAANFWNHVSPRENPVAALGFVDPPDGSVPPLWTPELAAAVDGLHLLWLEGAN